MTPITSDTIHLLFPELLVGSLAVAIYVAGAFVRNRAAYNIIAILGLVTAAWLLIRQESRVNVLSAAAPAAAERATESPPPGELAAVRPASVAALRSGPLIIDPLAQLIRFGVLLLGGLLTIAAWRAASDDLATDYLGSLLLAICGLMLVATANELVLLFIAFELISIPTYILLFLGRTDLQSQEAATKYFLLSILSSALLLYGLALLYGASGSTQLDQMRSLLAAGTQGASLLGLAPIALVLIVAGLAFKMAAVPFHFYAPDVYQGTTATNAGFLAVLPKIAGMVGLVRVVVAVAPPAEMSAVGWQLLLAVAVVTMTLGNVLALWQNNVRRMMAYSSIAHAGYMLVGVAVALAAVGGPTGAEAGQGLAAAVFYLGVYSFATLGTFAALAALATRESELNLVDDLAGIARRQPTIAIALAVFMFSLIGIPPLAGFWGKFRLVSGALGLDEAIFDPAVVQWFRVLAVITVLNAAISAGYYLRIVATMYFGDERQPRAPMRTGGPRFAAVACTVIVVLLGIAPGQFWSSTDQAARSVLQEVRTPVRVVTDHPEASQKLAAIPASR